MTIDDYPPMPQSEAEWRSHVAFYRLTVIERDAAQAEVAALKAKLSDLMWKAYPESMGR